MLSPLILYLSGLIPLYGRLGSGVGGKPEAYSDHEKNRDPLNLGVCHWPSPPPPQSDGSNTARANMFPGWQRARYSGREGSL